MHDLPGVLDGELDKLINALVTTDQAERLASLQQFVNSVETIPERNPEM